MTFVMAPHASTADHRGVIKALAAIPLVLSSLVMAAHFYRGGELGFVLLALVAPLLVTTRERIPIRIVQFLLVAGAAEWLWTAYAIAQLRAVSGAPVTRMLLILGAVALFTALSAIPLPRLARGTR